MPHRNPTTEPEHTCHPWTQHPLYKEVFDNWFRDHPEYKALVKANQEVGTHTYDGSPHSALLLKLESVENRRKFEEDYAALRGRLKVVFDRECVDLRERFEACKFPLV